VFAIRNSKWRGVKGAIGRTRKINRFVERKKKYYEDFYITNHVSVLDAWQGQRPEKNISAA
jgi:hypothetical protein